MPKKVKSNIEKFREMTRKSLDSQPFSSSQYGEVLDWIDTGDFGLNRIISGDIYKGIPSGRVVVFGGESQSGKSFISAQVAANALNKNKFDVVYYFDGEGGAMKSFFESRGCNLDNIEHVLVDSVEDALIKIVKQYKDIREFQKEEPNFKALFILDSIGALITNKVLSDVEKNKVANDMGLRAKICNLLVKATTIPALRTNVGLIIVNHVYDDPQAMYASKIKQQGGGKGIQYMARLVIQCSKKLEKDDNKDKQDERAFQFNRLRFLTVKNSFAQPTYESNMILDFKKGPLRYYSIFDVAVKYGFIVKKGSWYLIPSSETPDKNFRAKEILTKPKLWESFIDELNEKSIEELSYGGKEIVDTDTLDFEEDFQDLNDSDIEV